MVKRFYLDTAIWRDYFEERKDRVKPLGELTFQFLQNCRKHNCTIIIIAEPVLFELKDISKTLLDSAFSSFGDLLIQAPVSKKQIEEASELSKKRGLPFNDVLHAIVARDSNAIVITRDFHFEKLQDIVESVAPEEATF